jgi:hypothetical protein
MSFVVGRPGENGGQDKAAESASKPCLFWTVAGPHRREQATKHTRASLCTSNCEAKYFQQQASSHVHQNTRLRADE